MTFSDSSLQRRVKRYFNRSFHRLFIPCTPGLEVILHAEVESLLAKDESVSAIAAVHGGVELTAHVHAVYTLNLWLRTANRVMLRVGDFWADSLPAFFGHAKRFPWEVFIGNLGRVQISTSSTRSRLSTGQALNNALIDAINERFLGMRSPVRTAGALDGDAPTIYVRVHEDRVTVSVDTSGDHLYKRGYRTAGGAAPIRPTTAAALLLFSRWNPRSVLVDPFCGSGTIPIEAALLREDLPPGRQRGFAFESLPFHNESLWSRLLSQAAPSPAIGDRIIGSDIDGNAVRLAQMNLQQVDVLGPIQFHVKDAMNLKRADLNMRDDVGGLVMNLPYGKRVSLGEDPGRFANSLLRRLRQEFPGWQVAFALPRVDQDWNEVLQGPDVLDTLNGGIPIRFVRGQLK